MDRFCDEKYSCSTMAEHLTLSMILNGLIRVKDVTDKMATFVDDLNKR